MSSLHKFVYDIPLFIAIGLLSIVFLSLITLYIPPPSGSETQLREVARELKELGSKINKTSVQFYALLIFLNNARVNVLFAIPFISIIMYPLTLFSTAWVLRIAIAEAVQVMSGTIDFQQALYMAIALLLTSPHTYIEMLAYSITFICSNKLMLALLTEAKRRKGIEDVIVYYIVALTISFTLLVIAAFVESYAIAFFS